MSQRLVVIGAGGFGREVLDVIEAINFDYATTGTVPYHMEGFLDDGEPDGKLLATYGAQHLGTVEHLANLDPEVGYVIGIGNPQTRASIDAYGRSIGRTSPSLIHPTVSMGREIKISPGVIVCAGVTLTNHITLGRHVHVNLNSTIGHDAVLGDFATLSPQVALSGNVVAGARAFFGTGCNINPGVTVGEDAVVGSGAAVIGDVQAGVTVGGVPAKPLINRL